MAPPERTRVTGDAVIFRLPDSDPAITGVRLWQQLGLSAETVAFHRDSLGGWSLRLPRSAVAEVERLEYCYVVDAEDEQWRLDPTNPLCVPGPFGAKSVLELPGYRAPSWLGERDSACDGEFEALSCPDTPAGPVEGRVWSPRLSAPDRRLPLLVVHDGPEMAEYACLIDYVATMIGTGRVPPVRVALLSPGPRNQRYSASPDYADALADDVIPALRQRFPTSGRPIVAGASLGGLAALHAEWHRPGTFSAVFAQSGSFFTLRTDEQESGFEYFTEITNFVRSVHASRRPRTRARVVLTCGAAEENLSCNWLMASTMSRLGINGLAGLGGETLAVHPDLHTWTCWRDTFHPYLTDLLADLGEPSTEAPGAT